MPSSASSTTSVSPSRRALSVAADASACLTTFARPSQATKYAVASTSASQTLVGRSFEDDGKWRPENQGLQGRGQATLGQDRRVHAAGELT